MTSSPKLSTDQLLRIEALKVASTAAHPEWGTEGPELVLRRAESYLFFLQAKPSPNPEKLGHSTVIATLDPSVRVTKTSSPRKKK